MDKSPSLNHEEKFLQKLKQRTKKYINLTPFFIKVCIVVFFIYLCSIFIWHYFIRKENDKPIIETVLNKIKRK